MDQDKAGIGKGYLLAFSFLFDRTQPMVGNSLYKFLFYLVLVLLVQPILSSCKSQNETHAGKGKEGGASQHVVYRLKWLYNASVAGDIWAQEGGIFKAHGLDVEVKEGGPEQDAIKDLELHRAHFGVASADQVIRAAEKGAKVVVLAQFFQINPLQWIYDASRCQINDPRGLKRYIVGVTYGSNDEAILMALLGKYHISLEQVKLYAVTYDFNPFWKGEVDLWPVYKNTQGILLSYKMEKNHQRPGFFDPNRFGIHFVANSLITSRWLLEKDPGLVSSFTKAIIEAWRQAMDPDMEDRIVQAIHDKAPDTPLPIIKRQLQATREMVAPSGVTVGNIDKEAWQQTYEIMLSQGLIKHELDVNSLLEGPPL